MSRIPRSIAGSLPLLLAVMLVLGLAQIALATDNGNGQGNGNNGNNGNSGNGNNGNNGKGNDKDKEKDKDKKDKKEKNGQQTEPVTASGGYTIDVRCLYQEVDDHTTCTFTGVALEDAKKINHLVVPAETLCAEVLGSDGRFVDPDPNTHVTGYRTPGSTATTDIVLAGRVTAEGKATYWFKTGGNVFPVSGPGLACAVAVPPPADTPAASATETTVPVMTPTPDVTDSSGAVLVQVYQCPIANADAAGDDYDWYGACTPGGGNHSFALTGKDAASPGQTQATMDDGQVQFGDVAPGLYSLTLTEGAWCHAESDEVDAGGNVIVTAGEQTTVWIFTCSGG
jgi:hypothetical protein